MGEGTRARPGTEGALVDRVAELERMVERLVVELRQEVRTERLVVVDELDVERIATRVTATASTLQVIAPGERARARLEAVCGEAFEEPIGTRPRPAAIAVVIAETDRDGSVIGDSAALAAYSDLPPEVEIHDHRDSASIGASATLGAYEVRVAPRPTL